MREVRETPYLVGVSFQSTKSVKRRKCSLMEYFDGTRAFDLQMLIVHCIVPTLVYLMLLSCYHKKKKKNLTMPSLNK